VNGVSRSLEDGVLLKAVGFVAVVSAVSAFTLGAIATDITKTDKPQKTRRFMTQSLESSVRVSEGKS
jgi:hypothetical protein